MVKVKKEMKKVLKMSMEIPLSLLRHQADKLQTTNPEGILTTQKTIIKNKC
jgi:hypothetical protein